MFEAKVQTSSWWTAPDLMKLSWVASAGGCDGLVGSWDSPALTGWSTAKEDPTWQFYIWGYIHEISRISQGIWNERCVGGLVERNFGRNFRRRQTLHASGASPEGKFVCMTNTWRFCKRPLFLLLSRWPWENFNDRFNIHASLISKMLQRSSTSSSINIFVRYLCAQNVELPNIRCAIPMCFFGWTPAASIVWLTRKQKVETLGSATAASLRPTYGRPNGGSWGIRVVL